MAAGLQSEIQAAIEDSLSALVSADHETRQAFPCNTYRRPMVSIMIYMCNTDVFK